MKYLWYSFKNFYDRDECKNIYNTVMSNSAKIGSDQPGQGKNVAVHVFETTTDVCSVLSKFFYTVKEINKENFGLKLFNELPGGGNLNIYSGNTNYYGYHRDASEPGAMQDVKITAILNISENSYKGGEFDFFTGIDQLVPDLNNPGSLLIFPSFLWHRVRPVTAGERLTISYWFYGPNFR